MQPRRPPWWAGLSVAQGRIPTVGLVVTVAILAVVLLVSLLFGVHGVRDLPAVNTAPAAQPTTNGRYVYTPRSGRVSLGVSYRMTVPTHCGLDWPPAVDFDGSFWDPLGTASDGQGNPPSGFGNPTDQGVMTLVAADTAVYRSQHGTVLRFRRHSGTRVAVPCY